MRHAMKFTFYALQALGAIWLIMQLAPVWHFIYHVSILSR